MALNKIAKRIEMLESRQTNDEEITEIIITIVEIDGSSNHELITQKLPDGTWTPIEERKTERKQIVKNRLPIS